MTLIVHDVVLPLGKTEQDLPGFVSKRLGIPPRSIETLALHRRSLDCRRGRPPRWVCAVLIEVKSVTREKLLKMQITPISTRVKETWLPLSVTEPQF